jgi:RNA-splicing ligase RtcB
VSNQIKIFGTADERTRAQIERCAEQAAFAVLCADNHVGYSQPIGGAVAFEDAISPSGVGYDIGCGNKAVRTTLRVDDVDVAAIMDEIARRISFGLGRVNDEPVDHPVLDQIAHADFQPQRNLLQQARNQLGTVGSGNHYVDLFADDDGRLWIGVHFGSRGFGHRTATGFLAMADGGGFQDRPADGEMDAPPVLLDTRAELGQAYVAAMTLAGRVMSRRRAAGRTRRRKTFSCMVAGCAHHGASRDDGCPDHPGAALRKGWYTERLSPGEIDWDTVRGKLRAAGLELRGAGADEAPGVYKRLGDVLAAHGDTIEVLHTLTPIGVAMAGAEVHDPYKD